MIPLLTIKNKTFTAKNGKSLVENNKVLRIAGLKAVLTTMLTQKFAPTTPFYRYILSVNF